MDFINFKMPKKQTVFFDFNYFSHYRVIFGFSVFGVRYFILFHVPTNNIAKILFKKRA